MALVLTMPSADNLPPTVEFPPFEDSVEFPPFDESIAFPQFDETIANMADSEPPRSPSAISTPTNKKIAQLTTSPGRQPSPQPTHVSLPYRNGNGNGHRVLRSATVGYTAPEFKGKKDQMELGMTMVYGQSSCSNIVQ
jgi:hypothetical protein